MKSSAAVIRWNQDFSSLGMDESVSFPFANSMFPRCRIAATTRNIASWKVVVIKEQRKNMIWLKAHIFQQNQLISYEINTCSPALIPTTSIALLVAIYSFESSTPSNSQQFDGFR
jgi:hypothetical protein